MAQEQKQARYFAIKSILENKTIPSQEKLRLELKKKGFDVTQATLSRDLKKLGINRLSSIGGAKYASYQRSAIRVLKALISEEVNSINSNESIIVVGTLPGCANVVGEFIDSQNNRDIIGTLAGDNTLLVIPSSGKRINSIKKYLKQILIEGKEIQ